MLLTNGINLGFEFVYHIEAFSKGNILARYVHFSHRRGLEDLHHVLETGVHRHSKQSPTFFLEKQPINHFFILESDFP